MDQKIALESFQINLKVDLTESVSFDIVWNRSEPLWNASQSPELISKQFKIAYN